MKSDDFRCPKCGCEMATRIPIELLDGTKGIWYSMILLSLFAGAISPFFLICSFISIVIIIFMNILKKIAYKNEWVMQCSRCRTEYTVPNPDREEIVKKAALKKKLKAEERAEYYRKKEEYKKNALEQNGVLLPNEILVDEIEQIGYHKNAFVTTYGNIKITDNALLYYNATGSFRIAKSDIIKINKKNYFFFIPTGIKIKTSKRKIYLVTEPRLREEYILKLG